MDRTEQLTQSQYEVQEWLSKQVDAMIGIVANKHRLALPDASLVVGIPLLMQGVRAINIACSGYFETVPDHREVAKKVIALINAEYGLELQYCEGKPPEPDQVG